MNTALKSAHKYSDATLRQSYNLIDNDVDPIAYVALSLRDNTSIPRVMQPFPLDQLCSNAALWMTNKNIYTNADLAFLDNLLQLECSKTDPQAIFERILLITKTYPWFIAQVEWLVAKNRTRGQNNLPSRRNAATIQWQSMVTFCEQSNEIVSDMSALLKPNGSNPVYQNMASLFIQKFSLLNNPLLASQINDLNTSMSSSDIDLVMASYFEYAKAAHVHFRAFHSVEEQITALLEAIDTISHQSRQSQIIAPITIENPDKDSLIDFAYRIHSLVRQQGLSPSVHDLDNLIIKTKEYATTIDKETSFDELQAICDAFASISEYKKRLADITISDQARKLLERIGKAIPSTPSIELIEAINALTRSQKLYNSVYQLNQDLDTIQSLEANLQEINPKIDQAYQNKDFDMLTKMSSEAKKIQDEILIAQEKFTCLQENINAMLPAEIQ